VLWRKNLNDIEKQLYSKSNLTFVFIATSLVLIQLFSICKAFIEENGSILGGLLGSTSFEYSNYRAIFYVVLPIVFLQASTLLMNISWYEIIKRFDFLIIAFVAQVFALVLYSIGLRNLLEVFSRNGLIYFVNIATYIPVIYVYSQIARINKFILLRLKSGHTLLRLLHLVPQVISLILILVLLYQSSLKVSNGKIGELDRCPYTGSSNAIKLEEFFSKSTQMSYFERQEKTLAFMGDNLSERDYRMFLSNPLKAEFSLKNPNCMFFGAGYLYVNGFDQSKGADMRVLWIQDTLHELRSR
jgi:hypothetical protein